MTTIGLDYTLTLRIPFQTSKQVSVAFQSLSPDPELKPDQLSKEISIDGLELVVDFRAVSDRVLRVAVNSFFDCVSLVIECLDELDQANLALNE